MIYILNLASRLKIVLGFYNETKYITVSPPPENFYCEVIKYTCYQFTGSRKILLDKSNVSILLVPAVTKFYH